MKGLYRSSTRGSATVEFALVLPLSALYSTQKAGRDLIN